MKERGRRTYRETPAEAIARSVTTLGISPLIGIVQSAIADFKILIGKKPAQRDRKDR
ncbi:MAG: hypothetical protein ISN26_06110 [Betaproteobacteria bacterium AqS2]|uniref:Uncharacterized protein n=1 Tax=Candidatus Amphirhobacter heronislandensis TaxID=1732024 RepID=A0A930UH26_9GAMM|nr:hypothetical protein [Betaproteobacteria bacterium AqS2]